MFPPATTLSALASLPLAAAGTLLVVGLAAASDLPFRAVARALAFDALPVGVLVVDGEGRVIESNPAARRLPGVPDSVDGRALRAVLPGEGAAGDLAGGGRAQFPVAGEEGRRYLEAVAVTVGRIPGLDGRVVVLRDVTERRRTEERFGALLEHASELVLVVESDGTVTYAAPSTEGVLGFAAADLRGGDAFGLLHPEDRDPFADELWDLVGSGGTHRGEYRLRHADGGWRSFRLTVDDRLGDPAVGGLVVTGREVTRRRRLERRIQVLSRVLRHDIRNEANVVSGRAQVIKKAVDADYLAEHAGAVRDRAERLVELADEVRRFERALGRGDEDTRPVDAVETVRSVLEDAREAFPSAEFGTDLPEERLMLGNDLVEPALSGVVENAVEHSDRARPSVRVAVEPASEAGAEYVEVRVADDGPGIPEPTRRLVTEGVETPLEHSSGLGLWIAVWTVERCDGELRFEDNDPRGTVVVMRFRATDPEADPEPEPGPALSDPGRGPVAPGWRREDPPEDGFEP